MDGMDKYIAEREKRDPGFTKMVDEAKKELKAYIEEKTMKNGGFTQLDEIIPEEGIQDDGKAGYSWGTPKKKKKKKKAKKTK